MSDYTLRITDDQSCIVLEGKNEDILIEGLGIPHYEPKTAGNFLTVNRMLLSHWNKPLIEEHPTIFDLVNEHRYPECRAIGCGCARRTRDEC